MAALAVVAGLAPGCASSARERPNPTPVTPTVEPPAPTGGVFGIDLGPYTRPGQDPTRGDVIGEEQLGRLLDLAVAAHAGLIRTYGCGHGLDAAGALAHARGLRVAMTAWVGPDRGAAAEEVDCLVRAARRGDVDIAIVGSEALLRGDVTSAVLAELMARFRAGAPGVAVTTADVLPVLVGAQMVPNLDVLWVHAHPYWAGVGAEEAAAWTRAVWAEAETAAEGKPVWIGETGWPTAGAAHAAAVPSEANQARILADLRAWATAASANVLWFELADEGWKTEPGGVGPHWGLFAGDLRPKQAARCLLVGAGRDAAHGGCP